MDNEPIERDLNRRFLLRGGAILAGAAGATALGAALVPSAAQAADGQFAVTGEANASESTTSFTIGSADGSASPTMTLGNTSGPSLLLPPTGAGYHGGLAVGEIAGTDDGLDIGVDVGLGAQTTWLATGLDLDQIPFLLPIAPFRLVDTRSASGRDRIKSTSAKAFDSSFRLKARAWMDVGIIESGLFGLDAVFVNVTAVKPVKGGHLIVYPPGERPLASTLNFQADQTSANGAFILAAIADEDKDWYVIRIFSTAVTHLAVDLTGVTLRGISGVKGVSKRGTISQRNAVKANRMKRVFR